jgi:hypothetical protein
MPESESDLPGLEGLVFHDYSKSKPPEGRYIWRMLHKSKSFTLIFTAEQRARWAGYRDVISPEFDYWDGYSLLLPEGLIEWAEIPVGISHLNGKILEIVGVKNTNCPFCGNQPEWRSSGGYIGASPLDQPDFHLECCKWFNGSGNSSRNPVALSSARNAAIWGAVNRHRLQETVSVG